MENDLKLEIKLPKVPDIELIALEGLNHMGGFLGITDEKIGEARVIVTEAIINAFEHSGEENHIVNVEFIMTKKTLTIFVTDFGSGFDFTDINEPEINEKLASDSKRGWGLKLMKSMSDDFVIESGKSGTKITLVKNLV